MVFRFHRDPPRRLSAAVVFAAALAWTAPAAALPALQLDIVGAPYVDSETIDVFGTPVTIVEGDFSLESSFTLRVLGVKKFDWVDRITDLTLYFAFEAGDYEKNSATGSVTVSDITDGGSTLLGETEPARFGVPDGLPEHGVYPSYYLTYRLPDLHVGAGAEEIFDVEPGQDGSGVGDILELRIEYDEFFYIHMDVSGTAVSADGATEQFVFAPPSHDADADAPLTLTAGVFDTEDVGPLLAVDEPSSLAVFAFGLVGLGALRRRRAG